MISFIHLSDIHFNQNSGDQYDPDLDIRKELIKDITEHAKAAINEFTGILLCGDITFSAKEDEYSSAKGFLTNICKILSIPESSVYCVPGNHDVDQGKTKVSKTVLNLQKDLENANNQYEFDKLYGEISRNETDVEVLYSPLRNYNNFFASVYKCVISNTFPSNHFNLPISDNYELAVFLMNSTLISSHLDRAKKEIERPMRIPTTQIPPSQDKNTVTLTLCHHPPTCWVDHDEVLQRKLGARTHIQLYGHKHTQAILHKECLIINSGATHPDRGEEWQPRYNWISIDVIEEGSKPVIEVKVYPRVLDSKTSSRFIADPQLEGQLNYTEHKLSLENEDDMSSTSTETQNISKDVQPAVITTIIPGVSDKTFVYDFLLLPPVRRQIILKNLSLTTEEDRGKEHYEILESIISRAKNNNCLDRLWEEINKARDM